MIIRGVFSMTIINRLKSLFKGDNEETDINNDVSNTSDDVQVTSSQIESEPVVAEEEPVVEVEEATVEESEDSSEDLASDDIEPIEEKVEALKEEIHEKVEAKKEEIQEKVETIKEEIHEKVEAELDAEEADEDSKNNDKERDKMTLLTDKEAEFIDSGIETVKHCFQCGTCSGSCPSGRRTPYKVRQIVRKCLLGLKEEVITDDALWMCTTCYTCQERCLRSVKIVEIIKKARNIAAHAGYMAKPHKMTGVFVMNTGHGVPINDATKALRAKIGLPEIPPTTHAYPEALEEVQKICKITGFDELIGYDEATGGLKE